MYRNVYYDIFNSSIKLWTWNDSGDRVMSEHPYKPYIYVESQSVKDATSIYNTPLRKMEFKNQFDRRKYVKTSGIKRIFHNIGCEQQFMLEHFGSLNSSADFSKNPLKIFYLDIETYSPDTFPEPKIAADPVNLISIYDSLSNKMYTWGCKDYYGKSNTTYIRCIDEADMLKSFIKFWKKDHPDVVTTWNGEGFDIPYLINRITKVLGEDWTKRLSPVDHIRCQENVVKRFGSVESKWYISGVSLLDYMEVYKVFARDKRERYSLDYIGNTELGEGKIAYNATSLTELADKDWDSFVDYNVQDVNILVKLEIKLQYLRLCRMLGYLGLTTFEQALGTISIVTGAMALKAKEKNMIIPTFNTEHTMEYEGGFVREPERGFQDAVISFDANSLYPNTIITLNISPETKIGKILEKDEVNKVFKLQLINGKQFDLSFDNFMAFIEKEKIAISKAKVLYTQKVKGMCPDLVEGIYNNRVENKKHLKTFQRERKIYETKIKNAIENKEPDKIPKYKERIKEIQESIEKYDIMQFTLKILANRIYGAFANKYSSLCDIDSASSITLTGQACIKEASNIVDAYAKEKYGMDEKTSLTVYNDTDSTYFTIRPILSKLNLPFFKGTKISPDVYRISDEIQERLNANIKTWANKALNSYDPRFEFKREVICDSAIFIEKKRYILHVLDNEGMEEDKIKYVGVEVVSTATPKKAKPLIKKIVETMIKTRDYKKTSDVYEGALAEFKKLEIEDLAFPKGLHNYTKYAGKAEGFRTPKGCPIHVRSAIYYNELLKTLSLESKYEKIRTDTKIKYFYAAPNKYGINVVGFLDKYPQEFDIQMDVNKMFEKIVWSAAERLYNTVGWKLVNPDDKTTCNILELLS